MSCWVVPTVAAEIWGISLEQVMQRVRSGQVPSRRDEGFLFVDVAPDSPRCDPPRRLPEDRPPTFTVVTAEEREALCGDIDEDDPGDEQESEIYNGDWRTARIDTGRLRRSPREVMQGPRSA